MIIAGYCQGSLSEFTMGWLTAIPTGHPALDGSGALLLTGPFYLYIRTNDCTGNA
jgi:hypothetical protein